MNPLGFARNCCRLIWHVALLSFVLICVMAQASAEEKPFDSRPLPEPLTLEYALSQVKAAHPELQRIQAEIQAARAEEEIAESATGINTKLEARMRYYQPSGGANNRIYDDHKLGIFVDKVIYDFGRSDLRVQAARKDIQSQQIKYQDSLAQRRIDIMRRYFDVVLADLQFYRYNEEMSVAFVNLDKLRDKNELGQVSDIEVLEQEAKYQKVRKKYIQSQNLQRISRARLAYSLGRPGQLSATVARPENLPHLKRALPEVEVLQAQALEHNRSLQILRARISAAQARINAARADGKPVLSGGAEAGAYSKQRARYDAWRVNLYFTVPLTTGGRVDAAMAKERAVLYKLKAELADREEQIRQQILELWLQLDALRIQREQTQVESEYRELYLDRSRALYELEVKTDIGDAMVRVTEAEQQALQTDYNIVLAWEQLDALTGGMASSAAGQRKPQQTDH